MRDEHMKTPNVVTFGQRNAPLRACVVEAKPHVRNFLADMLETVGFVTRGCNSTELETVMPEINPDLILFGTLAGRSELRSRLQRLRAANYRGRIMLFGGRGSLDLIESQEMGESIGLNMLPFLGTPFRESELADNLSAFKPMVKPAQVAVDIGEALDKGWLELRYQPKIDVRNYTVFGASAFVFVKHPVWGISLPDLAGTAGSDKSMHLLAEFTVRRAREDWAILTSGRPGPLLSVNIPLPSLDEKNFVDWLCTQLGKPVRSGGIEVSISSIEAAGNLDRLIRAARTLNGKGIGVLIDQVGAEILNRLNSRDRIFTELKADPSIANGCADDDARRTICAKLVAAARACGARAVADGVRTRADFRVLCELGFDLVQGLLFAPPLEARKFMRLLTTHARVPA